MGKLSKSTWFWAALGLGVVALLWFGIQATDSEAAQNEAIAQCLTESGAKMFGAFWCPHCDAQKRMFGDAFEHIDYVECSLPDRSAQTQVCIDERIQAYPTWEFADGSRREGEMQPEQLAYLAGCESALES